jgi:hypothetical protein
MSVPAKPIKSLQHLCLEVVLENIDLRSFTPRYLHMLCRHLPAHICEPILEKIHALGLVTEGILVDFLSPSRSTLSLPGATQLRNSLLKQIGFHCPHLLYLNLSGCHQVGNSVIRGILQTCLKLTGLRLDGCHRISDSAFDMYESPFQSMEGCQSLELISLQGCNQITGKLAENLNKNCRSLTCLNLSQCKKVQSPAITELFNHGCMQSLDLSYIDAVCDDAFSHMPLATDMVRHDRSPLESLSMRRAMITDATLHRMGFFRLLKEIHLEWCAWISDDGIGEMTRGCPLLHSIDLKSCPITDLALGSIADHCRQLKSLNISWCQNVTDGGMKSLVHGSATADGAIENDDAGLDGTPLCALLENLSVVWCDKLTDSSLDVLGQLPSLTDIEAQGCPGFSKGRIASLLDAGIAVRT